MKRNLVGLLALVVALVGCAFNASASIDVDYRIANSGNTGNANNGSSGYQYLDTLNVKFNGTTYNNIFSGGILIQKTGETTGGPTMPDSYLSVCTDFYGTLYLGKTYVYSAPASSFATVLGQPGGGGIDPHWNNPAFAIQNAAQIFYTYGNVGAGGINTGSGTALTVDQMAALQMAIWIALYDTTGTGTIDTGGPFQLLAGASYSSVITSVTADLLGLNGNYFNTGYLLQPDPLTGPGSTQGNNDGQLPQELLMGSSNSGGGSGHGGGSVPEPTTVFAGALLLIPLGASAIRILRKSQAQGK